MEFIKIARRRSFLSSLAHILLNILLVVTIWSSIYITNSLIVAIVLIFVSKWRVFAVRPRFWLANVKSNSVDLIVCLGLAILIWAAGSQQLIAQGIISLVYVLWLIVLKPQSKDIFIRSQAISAVFIGFFALFSISYTWPLIAIVACAMIIGYSSMRHVLSSDENKNLELFSLIWGLIMAELAWLFSHWVVGYSFGVPTLAVPQVAIIASILSFLVFSFYYSYKKDGKLTFQEVIVPTVFSIVVCLILMIFFSMFSEI